MQNRWTRHFQLEKRLNLNLPVGLQVEAARLANLNSSYGFEVLSDVAMNLNVTELSWPGLESSTAGAIMKFNGRGHHGVELELQDS